MTHFPLLAPGLGRSVQTSGLAPLGELRHKWSVKRGSVALLRPNFVTPRACFFKGASSGGQCQAAGSFRVVLDQRVNVSFAFFRDAMDALCCRKDRMPPRARLDAAL